MQARLFSCSGAHLKHVARQQHVPLINVSQRQHSVFPAVESSHGHAPKAKRPMPATRQRIQTVERRIHLCATTDTASSSQLESISDTSREATSPPQKKQRLSDEEIAARIAESRQRKASLPQHSCPSCSKLLLSPRNIYKHVSRCCPDIMADPQTWEQVLCRDVSREAPVDHAAIANLLKQASAIEEVSRETALHWTFRSGLRNEEGQLIRLDASEVGRRMKLPAPRASRLVRAAMRAVPLVGDDITGSAQGEGGPGPLVVVHEDEDFVAVSKPPHVLSCPTHRFKGGSMVNQMITYMKGQNPHVLHRLDMDTSGLLLFAKHPGVVPGVHKQFRDRTISKLYLCICMGCPEEDCFDVDAPITHHPAVDIARAVGPGGKEASTSFAVIASNPHAVLPVGGGQAGDSSALGLLFDLESYLQGGSSLDMSQERNRAAASAAAAAADSGHAQYDDLNAFSDASSSDDGEDSVSSEQASMSMSSEQSSVSLRSEHTSAGGSALQSGGLEGGSGDKDIVPSSSSKSSSSGSSSQSVGASWSGGLRESGVSSEGSCGADAADAAAADRHAYHRKQKLLNGRSSSSSSSSSSSTRSSHDADSNNASSNNIGSESTSSNHIDSGNTSSNNIGSDSTSSHDADDNGGRAGGSIDRPLLGASLVACAPHSGRTHQIRLHMAHAGHPLLGDELYGVKVPYIKRQALHAAGMDLEHPIKKQRVRFLAPLPQDFTAALMQLGLLRNSASLAGEPASTHDNGGSEDNSNHRTMSHEQLHAAVEGAWQRLAH